MVGVGHGALDPHRYNRYKGTFFISGQGFSRLFASLGSSIARHRWMARQGMARKRTRRVSPDGIRLGADDPGSDFLETIGVRDRQGDRQDEPIRCFFAIAAAGRRSDSDFDDSNDRIDFFADRKPCAKPQPSDARWINPGCVRWRDRKGSPPRPWRRRCDR